MWKSSYEANRYGFLIYSIVRTQRPKTVVELGTKTGYTAHNICSALSDNKMGKLYCYDLWEDYPYSSCPMSETEENLMDYVEDGVVELIKMDAFEAAKRHNDIDILHIDLSNDGEILDRLYDSWFPKVNDLILLEGGSEERDKVEWMIKYNKKPIRGWLKEKSNDFQYITLNKFPSLTMIKL